MVMAATEAHASGTFVRGNVRQDVPYAADQLPQAHLAHRASRSVDFDQVFNPNGDPAAALPQDTKIPRSLADTLPFTPEGKSYPTTKLPASTKSTRRKSYVETQQSNRAANVRSSGKYGNDRPQNEHAASRAMGAQHANGGIRSVRPREGRGRHARRSSDLPAAWSQCTPQAPPVYTSKRQATAPQSRTPPRPKPSTAPQPTTRQPLARLRQPKVIPANSVRPHELQLANPRRPPPTPKPPNTHSNCVGVTAAVPDPSSAGPKRRSTPKRPTWQASTLLEASKTAPVSLKSTTSSSGASDSKTEGRSDWRLPRRNAQQQADAMARLAGGKASRSPTKRAPASAKGSTRSSSSGALSRGKPEVTPSLHPPPGLQTHVCQPPPKQKGAKPCGRNAVVSSLPPGLQQAGPLLQKAISGASSGDVSSRGSRTASSSGSRANVGGRVEGIDGLVSKMIELQAKYGEFTAKSVRPERKTRGMTTAASAEVSPVVAMEQPKPRTALSLPATQALVKLADADSFSPPVSARQLTLAPNLHSAPVGRLSDVQEEAAMLVAPLSARESSRGNPAERSESLLTTIYHLSEWLEDKDQIASMLAGMLRESEQHVEALYLENWRLKVQLQQAKSKMTSPTLPSPQP